MAAAFLYQCSVQGCKQRLRLFFLLIFFGLTFLLLHPLAGWAISSDVLINLTNQKRQELGLAPLQYNALLSASASAKAADMLDANYWSHVSPSGVQPWYFMQQSQYAYVTAGENLAKDFQDDVAVIDAWMNSPSHRANIVNPAFHDIGIAVIPGELLGSPTILIVAHYGATAAAAASVPPSTQPEPSRVVDGTESAAQPAPTPTPEVAVEAQPQTSVPTTKPVMRKHVAAQRNILHQVLDSEKPEKITFPHLLIGVFNKLADMNGLYIALFKNG